MDEFWFYMVDSNTRGFDRNSTDPFTMDFDSVIDLTIKDYIWYNVGKYRMYENNTN